MNDAQSLVIQEQAYRINARAEVRDVRMLSAQIELNEMPSPGGALTYDLDSEPEVQYTVGDDFFVVRINYRLVISDVQQVAGGPSENDQGEDSKSHIAEIVFSLAGLFALVMREGDPTPADEELEAYSLTTGHLLLYPYAREYIYDSTGRLGLPALSVGMLKLPVKLPVKHG